MHYEHSNAEVGQTDPETGKKTIWKCCDICGAQQHSNNGFTVSFQMPGVWGKQVHGYCSRCANKLIPLLTDALDAIENKEQEMRQTVPPGKQYVDKAALIARALAAEE